MRRAIIFAMEKGLTSVHTNDPTHLGGLGQTYQIYDELLNGEQLGLRCNLLIDHIYLNELKQSGMYAGYGNETRSEEHTSELQSRGHLVCRLLLEKKKKSKII